MEFNVKKHNPYQHLVMRVYQFYFPLDKTSSLLCYLFLFYLLFDIFDIFPPDNIYFEVRILNSSRVTVSQTSVPASQPAGVVFPDLDLGNHSVSVETVNSQLQLSSASVTIFVIVRQPGI